MQDVPESLEERRKWFTGELDADAIIALAECMTIQDHATGNLVDWVLNAEQRDAMRKMLDFKKTYFLKSRQIGLSTIVCFLDVVWTAAMDAAGHKVSTALIWDTEDNGKSKITLCKNFCEQLELPIQFTTSQIRFPHGSEIVAITAGGRGAGRSRSFQRYHLSEIPFWNRAEVAYQGIQAALGLAGSVCIETTMDIREPLAKQLWEDERNGYEKVFYGVEMHEEYRAPELVDELTDEDREWLKGEGFTRDDSMAWWVWNLRQRCNNDTVLAWRDFPQLPRHAFSASSNRFINVDPVVTKPIKTIEVPGVKAGKMWKVDIFRLPEDCSDLRAVAADTSMAVSSDRSAVTVMDGEDNFICASFASSGCQYDDVARVCKGLVDYYSDKVSSPRSPGGWATREPVLIVEDNMIGDSTVKECLKLGLSPKRHRSNRSGTRKSKERGLNLAMRAIERGEVYGPMALYEDCQSVHRRNGRFYGWKDVLVTIGFILIEFEDNYGKKEASAPPKTQEERILDGIQRKFRKNVAKSRRKRRMGNVS